MPISPNILFEKLFNNAIQIIDRESLFKFNVMGMLSCETYSHDPA